MILSQGKYRGYDITAIPTVYLEWAAVNLTTLSSEEAAAIMLECRRRRSCLSFENSVADPNAPGKALRQDRSTGIEGLRMAWHQCAQLFLAETGVTMKEPLIGVMSLERTLGLWFPCQRALKVSNYWILPRDVLRSVVIHEMCHQWISEQNIADNGPHGNRWKEIATAMAKATGLPVEKTVTPKGFVANSLRRREPDRIYFYTMD